MSELKENFVLTINIFKLFDSFYIFIIFLNSKVFFTIPSEDEILFQTASFWGDVEKSAAENKCISVLGRHEFIYLFIYSFIYLNSKVKRKKFLPSY